MVAKEIIQKHTDGDVLTMIETKTLVRHISELQAQLDAVRGELELVNGKAYTVIQQLDAVRKAANHHRDCNYWKWDWTHRWHYTDCSCPPHYFPEHDSDCSMHNEPAYENKECDCRLSGKAEHIAELQSQLEAVRTECIWTKSQIGRGLNWDEYDAWSTSCGEDYMIVEEWDEEPTKFCCNCGGKTIKAAPQWRR